MSNTGSAEKLKFLSSKIHKYNLRPKQTLDLNSDEDKMTEDNPTTSNTNTTQSTSNTNRQLLNTHILNDNIPLFRGNAKKNETDFKHGVEIESFLKIIENDFTNLNITTDYGKNSLLFGHIDPVHGDAKDLISTFNNNGNLPYEVVKNSLLASYGNTRNFQRSSQNLIHNQQLDTSHIVSSTGALVNNVNEVIDNLFKKQTFSHINKDLPITNQLSLIDFMKNSLFHIFISAHSSQYLYENSISESNINTSLNNLNSQILAKVNSSTNRYPLTKTDEDVKYSNYTLTTTKVRDDRKTYYRQCTICKKSNHSSEKCYYRDNNRQSRNRDRRSQTPNRFKVNYDYSVERYKNNSYHPSPRRFQQHNHRNKARFHSRQRSVSRNQHSNHYRYNNH